MKRIYSEQFYCDNEDRYWQERESAFKAHLDSSIDDFMKKTDVEDMTSENFAEFLEDFEFKSIEDWMADEIESYTSGYGDYLYEQEKDRRMGL